MTEKQRFIQNPKCCSLVPERVLHVVEQAPVDDESVGGDSFVIGDELQEISPETLDEIFRTFRRRAVRNDGSADPIYDAFWPEFAIPLAATPGDPTALTHLIPLYRKLDRRVGETEPDRIVCHGLQADYRGVVEDVADGRGVDVDRRSSPRAALLWGLVAALLKFSLLAVDQLAVLATRPFRDSPGPAETVFVPNVNRLGSLKPVIESTTGEFRVVVPNFSVPFRDRDIDLDVDERRIDPITAYTSGRSMLTQVRVFGRTMSDLLVRRTLQSDLTEFVAAEHGVEMPRTVDHCVANLAPTLNALPFASLMNEVVRRSGCSAAVFGSMGPKQLGMLRSAQRSGVRTYHVPHTATTGYEPLPSRETVHFAPSRVAVDHFEASDQVDSASNVVPAGRPYLAEVGPPDRSRIATEEPLRFVIATQPFRDEIREAFVAEVIAHLEAVEADTEVVIKIHPNEEPQFYDRFRVESDRVTVQEEGLFDLLRSADLTFTINSNVGLESMVLGTPTCCVNLWSPIVRIRPYAEYGPVPALRSSDALSSFADGLSVEEIDRMTDEQTEYVEESYVLDPDCSERIAATISDDT